MSGQPTPGPWWIDRLIQGSTVQYIRAKGPGSNNAAVAKIYTYRGMEQAEANARFIVQACNSHDELLEAAKRVGTLPEGEDFEGEYYMVRVQDFGLLQAAIAKAEGRE